MSENRSEVAQLLRRIEAEYEAAQQGLTGYAEVARHTFITARMEQIETYHAALGQLVGEHEATRLVATVFSEQEPNTVENIQFQHIP